MEKYKFINNSGDFILNSPEKYSGLYFPIANSAGMKSAVTPLLSGDAKTDQNTFILQPVSIRDLADSRVSRNFWLYFKDSGAWSVTGASSKQEAERFSDTSTDESFLEAGLLWHKITRKNKSNGIKAEVLSFCPETDDTVELHKVTITNTGENAVTFKPYTAIPLYCRSADNIRDHRHVTSLLHRIKVLKNGIKIDPTLTFDERGHRLNTVEYGVYAACCDGSLPIGFMPSVDEFIGEGGSLTNPQSIGSALPYKEGYCLNGEECIAAMQFEDKVLNAGESISYIIVLAVDKKRNLNIQKYLCEEEFDRLLETTKEYWQKAAISHIHTADKDFDNWIKWVSAQPLMRRMYGCSFLPHHDYGRGGRGWRDLWQDCLALLLSDPNGVREILVNNFAGVRIDGTNATIIGEAPGEFIADRNNITRVWMDHGAWSTVTTKLYIDQTGDNELLIKDQVYFKDIQACRAKDKDTLWNDSMGNNVKTDSGEIYYGSILEHLILQNLSVFFNVGEHNIMRLEGADWNDGLDMAANRGESVAFTCLYYKNLLDISAFIADLKAKGKQILLSKELFTLLDYANGADYNSIEYKTDVLKRYCEAVKHCVSGERIAADPDMLICDLTAKAEHLKQVINQNEIISCEKGKWYNSYYDDSGRKTEGVINGKTRMMLTGQTFAVMSGIADEEMINSITKSADALLFSEEIGGYKLNTDFKEIKTDLGRLFGFAYGHKENGAVFSHMAVMYANGLYQRNHAEEGFKALNALYKAADNFSRSHIYPAIPEYFDPKGHGLYSYLTGSASWYMMTVICEMFGVKGKNGALVLEPKLLPEQFDADGTASIEVDFFDRKIKVCYQNQNRLEPNKYSVKEVKINGDKISINNSCGIDRNMIPTNGECVITVELA
ncbi:MAG: cellobiose phosphorylase [Ruminococcaceae bacterium]|nr:cellobiose phosphorylase [Oscillospiraceae bacterium]